MTEGHAEPGGYRPGYELAAERILELISEMGLVPGDRMPTEVEIATRIQTSRSVVREAIKILSALGRVRAQKGRGLYVADDEGLLGGARPVLFLPTNLEHVYRLFEFRRIQETEASRLAAERATPSQLLAMRSGAADCRRAVELADFDLFAAGDDAFHLAVAKGADNPFLEAAIQQSRRAQRQTARLGLPTHVVPSFSAAADDHDAILAAIRAGRPDQAAAAAAAHIDRTLNDYRIEIEARVFGTGRDTG